MKASRILSSFISSQSFTPGSLSNKVFWLNANTLTESGGEISSWTNKYSSNHAVAIGGRNTPNQVTDAGKYAVQFTRANTEILRASAVTGIVDWTLFIVFKANNVTNRQVLFSNIAATSGIKVSIVSSTIEVLIRNNLGTITKTFAFTDTASYHVLTIKKQNFGKLAEGSNSLEDVGRMVCKIDNVVSNSFGNLNNTYASSAAFDFGSDTAGTDSFDGYIREIVFTSGYLTEADERSVYSYFNTTWGLTVTTTMPSYTFTATALNSTLGVSSTLGTASLRGDLSWYANTVESGSPVIIAMHDFPGAASALGTEVGPRLAQYFSGSLVIAPNMRGKGASTGTQDCNGQEAYDIYDVYQNFLSIFSKMGVSSTKLVIVGWSGGGGNAMGFGAKFPDLPQLVISNYGISDYGYSGTTSWYVNLATVAYKSTMDTGVGGTPRTSYLNEYSARNSVDALAKNFIGKVFLFHDTGDASIEVAQSQLVNSQFTSEGKSAYIDYNESNAGSGVRWTHTGVPSNSSNIAQAELDWKIETLTPSTIAASGTLIVAGFVKTKRFTLILGNGTSSLNGKNRKATLVYNYTLNSYTLTPSLESGASDMTYSFTDDIGRTSSGTISSQTTFSAS